MDYKRIIKNQKLRYAILNSLSFVPDRLMLKLQYRIKLGRCLNWNHPKRFTEFIQKYKAYYRNSKMIECVDKLQVKNYVASKGFEKIIPQLYGSYASVNQIDFDLLPSKFVLKTTNGGGGENVIICNDKSKLNFDECRKKLDSWLRLKTVDAGREWAYTGNKNPKIIVEEMLLNPENPTAGIEDYKILCFNGIPKIIIYDCDRYVGHKRNFYDTEWNRLQVISDCPGKNEDITMPTNLHEMLAIASVLSSDFPFVRVDLYNINGRIYFGELTFYPWSGYVKFIPDSFDFELGQLFSDAWRSNNQYF